MDSIRNKKGEDGFVFFYNLTIDFPRKNNNKHKIKET